MIKLRELRTQFGYSVKDMCAKLGVDDSRYRKWESGTNGLPLLLCVDMAWTALYRTDQQLFGMNSSEEQRLAATWDQLGTQK